MAVLMAIVFPEIVRDQSGDIAVNYCYLVAGENSGEQGKTLSPSVLKNVMHFSMRRFTAFPGLKPAKAIMCIAASAFLILDQPSASRGPCERPFHNPARG